MNRIFKIAQILDKDCLTTEMLDKVCQFFGRELTFIELQKYHRFQIYYELMGACGTNVMEALESNLDIDEIRFISGRIELFLTARGFEKNTYPPKP